MSVSKLNNHPVIQGLDGQWIKICALLLHKLSKDKPVQITAEEVTEFYRSFASQLPTVVCRGLGDQGIEFRVMGENQARDLAAREGGWSN